MDKERRNAGEAGMFILIEEADKLREKNPSGAEVLNEAALDLADKIRESILDVAALKYSSYSNT